MLKVKELILGFPELVRDLSGNENSKSYEIRMRRSRWTKQKGLLRRSVARPTQSLPREFPRENAILPRENAGRSRVSSNV
eukprot:SAG31_NODE_10213_length_1169_cov_2.528972_1_plen_79_part_10